MFQLSVTRIDEIIKNCQKGKRKAQHQLYQLYAAKMMGVCLRYCKDRMEAEDCLQEGFIKVFTKIHLFGFKGSFEGWVRRIIVNTIIEHFRKKKLDVLVDDFPLVADVKDTDVYVPIVSEKVLLRLVQELPSQYRLVFNMYVIEGYSHKEIAEDIGISIGTSKSNLSRAKQWLKNKIELELSSKRQVVC